MFTDVIMTRYDIKSPIITTFFAEPEGEPVFVYNHSNGAAAVIGGYVYRGNAMKNLTGRYIFADMFTRYFKTEI
jgi:hypothetical protein